MLDAKAFLCSELLFSCFSFNEHFFSILFNEGLRVQASRKRSPHHV